MRPIKLQLKNFITYRDAEVDFTQLENHLFLIAGKTGAGKTSLFDGIMFAMYGETSGAEREAGSLHCNFDKENKPTEVTLDFEEGGKRYCVKRTLKYSKMGDSYVWKPDAVLEGPDFTEKGTTKVTKCIEELIGLSAKQFRQTSMLAQDKFREFLNGDTKTREEILSQLFDTSASRRFQSLISASCKKLNAECSALQSEMEFQTNQFESKLDADLPMIERLAFSVSAPDQRENMETYIRERELILRTLVNEKDRLLTAVQAVNTSIEAAKSENAKLDAMISARKLLENLRQKTDYYVEFKRENDRIEQALRYYLPAEKAMAEAEVKKRTAETELVKLTDALANAKKAVMDAEDALDKLSDTSEQIESRTKEKGAVEQLIPNYAEKERLAKMLKAADETSVSAKKNVEEQRTLLTAVMAKRSELADTIEKLKEAGEERLAAEAKRDKIRDDVKAIRELKTIVKKAHMAHAVQIQAGIKAEVALAELDTANQAYVVVNERYFAAQAANLACELGKQLTIGDANCPVCGIKHVKGTAIAFNIAETVERSEVDAARKHAETAQKDFEYCREQLEEARSACDNAWTAALTLGSSLIDAKNREDLSEERLDDEITHLSRTLDEANADLANAVERKQRLEGAKEESAKIQKREEAIRKALEDAVSQVNEADVQIASMKAAMDTIQLDPRFVNSEAAQSYITRLEREIAQLTAVRLNAEKTLKQAENKAAELQGRKETAEKNCLETAEQVIEREKEMNIAVIKAGFEGRESAKTALAAANGDPETWLDRRNKELKEYEKVVHAAETDAEARTREAAGCERRDLEQLNKQAEDAEKAYNEAETRWSKENNALEIQRSAAEKIAEIRKRYDTTNAAFKRLDGLNEIANGKQTFAIWQLAADFKDVLKLSNAHLQQMSGGRFELAIKEEITDARKANGLDIEVLDHDSGHRESPKALSGGEGFETSMALALGLSDAARSNGMRKVETLFVDEGFGTLDDEVLDQAIKLLRGLSDGNRTVGIISHVNRLEESIRPQLCVTYKENKGSTAEILV